MFILQGRILVLGRYWRTRYDEKRYLKKLYDVSSWKMKNTHNGPSTFHCIGWNNCNTYSEANPPLLHDVPS